MNTRQFLKTLCLVPIGAVVEKLPGHGVATMVETQGEKQIFDKAAQRHMLNEITRPMTMVRHRRFEGWGNDAIGKAF